MIQQMTQRNEPATLWQQFEQLPGNSAVDWQPTLLLQGQDQGSSIQFADGSHRKSGDGGDGYPELPVGHAELMLVNDLVTAGNQYRAVELTLLLVAT